MARLNDVKLQALLDAVNELKTDLNNLRADFRAHDHGAADTYGSTDLRINADVNTITGTEASTAVSASIPTTVDDLYN